MIDVKQATDYSVKSYKKAFKDKGIFYTPPELVERLKSYIDVAYTEVYDPTCGHGGILGLMCQNCG